MLTTCEICQTERAIEAEARVIRHDARILHRLQLPPMLRTFPSVGLEVVKKSLWISNDSRLTVITLNVVRHVPRASGPFL